MDRRSSEKISPAQLITILLSIFPGNKNCMQKSIEKPKLLRMAKLYFLKLKNILSEGSTSDSGERPDASWQNITRSAFPSGLFSFLEAR